MTIDDLTAEFARSATELSEEDVRRAGPYTRKVIRWLKRTGNPEGQTGGYFLGGRRALRRGSSVIGLVLARAAIDLARAVSAGLTGRAHEAFDGADSPADEPTSSTFGEALVRALPRGEQALAAVVLKQASEMFGQSVPIRQLTREVRRRIELFELLAYECQRLGIY